MCLHIRRAANDDHESKIHDITKHPQYKYLSDADKRNTFDVAGFLKHRLKVKPEDKFEVYETEV